MSVSVNKIHYNLTDENKQVIPFRVQGGLVYFSPSYTQAPDFAKGQEFKLPEVEFVAEYSRSDTPAVISTAATANVAENATLAIALVADKAVTWTKSGADTAQFAITGSALTWVANGTQDFETPLDAGANNVYNVNVIATDQFGNATTKGIAVTVTDVSE